MTHFDANPDLLRVLSFNMHAGARADGFGDYLTKAWQHILPSPSKITNLREIASAIAGFDMVCLQEADGGSTRSGFMHQSHQLAMLAGFSTVIDQRNRKVGLKSLPFACSGNSILARRECVAWKEHSLPARLPGRGVLVAQFGELTIFNVHLALTPSAQQIQLEFIAGLINACTSPQVLLMGDFNCTPNSPPLTWFRKHAQLQWLPTGMSFPSWAPQRQIDLIFYRGLKVSNTWILPTLASDHLAVAAEFSKLDRENASNRAQ